MFDTHCVRYSCSILGVFDYHYVRYSLCSVRIVFGTHRVRYTLHSVLGIFGTQYVLYLCPLPEDKPTGSKYVDIVRMKILV